MKPGRQGIGPELILYALALAGFLAGTLQKRLEAAPFEPGPRGANILRIVTWNVGAGLEHGGLKEEHVEHVARTLAQLDPDLVFLQEIAGHQVGPLVEQLTAVGGAWVREWARGVAVLAQRGTLEELPLEGSVRARAQGVLYRSPGGPSIAAVGLHASAFSARARNAAIGAAATALFARSELKILAGDLNLDLDLDKRRDLFSDDEHLDVETYNFVAERLFDTGRGRGPTAEPDRRLDYVFVSNWVTVRGAGPWKERRAPGMDHDPLVVDLLPTGR